MKSLLIVTLGLILLIAAFFAASGVSAIEPFPMEYYGWVDISSSGKTFYALQSTISSAQERAKRPLIQFASGGPGAASTAFGMMLETGKDQVIFDPTNHSKFEVVPRKYAWPSLGTALYADIPMGTGWSNTQDTSDFCTTDECIGKQLVVFYQGFLKKHPEFNNHEIILHGESYSGKAIAFIANALLNAKIPLKIKAVNLADGWVDPIAIVKSYGPYYEAFSQLSPAQAKNLTQIAYQAEAALEAGNNAEATNLWGVQQDMLEEYAAGSNIYNILHYTTYFPENGCAEYMSSQTFRDKIEKFEKIPEGFAFNKDDNMVFSMMQKAFMMSGVEAVQSLIDANVSVNIINGQVDGIVDALGIRAWVRKLPWSKLDEFQNAPRVGIAAPKGNSPAVWYYVQSYANVRFVSFVLGGHMVPMDVPEAVLSFMSWISGATPAPPVLEKPKKGTWRKKYFSFMNSKKEGASLSSTRRRGLFP